MHSTDNAVARSPLFVGPSICPSHAGILSKRLNISSIFFTSGSHIISEMTYKVEWDVKPCYTIPHHFNFPIPNIIAIETSITWAWNAGGYEKIATFDQYLALSRKLHKIGP